jgi:hypothetical protein
MAGTVPQQYAVAEKQQQENTAAAGTILSTAGASEVTA